EYEEDQGGWRLSPSHAGSGGKAVGGGDWIRTSVRLRRADLQSAGFNHSPTPPGAERDGLTPAQMRPKRSPASQRSASYSDEGSTTQPLRRRRKTGQFQGRRRRRQASDSRPDGGAHAPKTEAHGRRGRGQTLEPPGRLRCRTRRGAATIQGQAGQARAATRRPPRRSRAEPGHAGSRRGEGGTPPPRHSSPRPPSRGRTSTARRTL